MSQGDEQFLRQIRQRLDASAEGLDARTLARLRSARTAALARSTRRQRPWWPAGLAAAAVVLLVVGLMRFQSESTPQPIEDLALLGADAELEMLEELDFYLWLNDDAG